MVDRKYIREKVRRDYAALVTLPVGAVSGEAFAKGVAVRAAGYTDSDVSDLPRETVANALGCGNPVAFGAMREGDVVLDLGSGAGIDLLLAARKVGSTGHVIGVDMTDEMNERAQAAIDRAGLTNVEVRKGLIESLPLSDATVDWVISNCVVNLSPEKDRVFAEIARVLRPGGRMLVSDIVVEGISEEQKAALGPISCCLGGAISECAYREGLAKAGLLDIEVRDRIEYDEVVLKDMVRAQAGAEAEFACCGSDVKGFDVDSLQTVATQLAGKVRAIYIHARKPR
ncbi:MAG: methyltransferase domain-containing protein [Planctomycetota bacterium]|jgi:SAM-dependent methyltransferase